MTVRKKVQKQIILIEDEQTLANLIKVGLERHGFSVKVETNGILGLALIRRSAPDLVLLDMMLPGLGGFEILEALHEDGRLPHLPVIIISNSGQPIEIERSIKLGVKDYLVKANFNPDEVIQKVLTLFQKNPQERAPNNRKPRAGKKQRHILLVEDDLILSSSLDRKFTQNGYIAFKAFSAKEAQNIIKNNHLDFILLDIILPDIDGFQFLRQIKEAQESKDIPVFIISNLGQREEIRQGLEAGAMDYIVKAQTVPEDIFNKVEDFFAGQCHL